MKTSKSILWIIVALAALAIIGRIGFYIAEIKQIEKGAALSSASAAEPNKPGEDKKTGDPNATVKAEEAEKPAEPNDSQITRPERGPMPGGEPAGEARTGRFGFSPEDRERMEEMRARWENATDEEREELRAQMRERFGGRRQGEQAADGEPEFGGRRPRGERATDSERTFGGERRPGPRLQPRDPNDPNAPPEPNEPNEPTDPNKIMENVNLKDMQMKDIVKKLADWTGKVIIPADDAMNQKITIYSTKELPRTEAITMIYTALRAKGIVAEQSGNVIELKSLKDIRLGPVPTVQADYALAMIENKKQVVQKFFKLNNYAPTQMSQVVKPLIGDYGYVSADETTGQLLVIDTVENLMRIERIIDQFDVPEAEQTVTKVISVKFGDPSEIVQMLKILLGESEGISTMRFNRFRSDRPQSSGPSSSQQRTSGQSGSGSSRPSESKGEATSVTIESTRGPVVLIPEPRRKWIIAKASAEDMKRIEEWIDKLDMKEPVQSEYEVVQLRYADPREIEDSVGDGFRDLPGMEFLPSILIEPLVETKQVIVFGRQDLREIVKKMIEQIDVPPGQFETRHFKINYADPDQIKTSIDELFGEGSLQSSSSRSRSYSTFYSPFSRYSQSSSTSSDMVKTISYPSLKQVTVIASPENMLKIAEQIEQWDAPLDVNEVKPRIIELHNTDPVQMAELLTTLFSESSSGGGASIYDIIFGRSTEERQKIVGPLYGQLTFEDVPGTKKIIVISKIAEAYDVVEQLIRDLDKAEMGEIPKVVTLKYADPEDLAERLNAMFNEPGTTTTIQRTDRGLSAYSMDSGGTSSSTSQSGQGTTTSQADYRPWWTTGRQNLDEQPISNVIGRIRFVPDPRTKSILVLSPPEFMENIVQLIEELDIPGKQVMIKAVIMQVDHSNVTSLGLQLKSGTFDVGENAITVLKNLDYLEEHGAFTFAAGMDVTTMLDFLVKNTNAKILNQQTLWTKDNEEAMFFKGKRVAFKTEMGVTQQTTTQSIEFEQVGMTLRVRPSITPENNVDMIINVILSQLTADKENEQPVRTEMDTTTNMIVQHAQTLMLGGILFQTDSKVERKIPLLGDVPVAGGLFRHNNIVESNEELIVFITPYVIDEPGNLLPETKAEVEPPLEKLDNMKKELEAILGNSK